MQIYLGHVGDDIGLYVNETVLANIQAGHSRRKEVFVAFVVRIVAHDVLIGLRIVLVHLAVPGKGVGTAHKTSINDG